MRAERRIAGFLELLCNRCDRWLLPASFPVNPRMRHARGWCRPCQVERTREWRAEHRDEYLARQRVRQRAAYRARVAA